MPSLFGRFRRKIDGRNSAPAESASSGPATVPTAIAPDPAPSAEPFEPAPSATASPDEFVRRCVEPQFAETAETRTWRSDPAFGAVLTPLNARQYPQTIEAGQRILPSYRDLDLVYDWLGTAYRYTSQLERSREVLRDGIARARRKSSLLTELGQTEAQSGDLDQAVYCWSQAIHCLQSSSYDSDAYLLLSYVARGLGINDLERALLARGDEMRGGQVRLDAVAASRLGSLVQSKKTDSMRTALEGLRAKYFAAAGGGVSVGKGQTDIAKAPTHLERTLQGHTAGVKAVAVTPDGSRIVSGGVDGTVRVWDLTTGRLERTLEGHPSTVFAVTVTPDGSRIVSGGYDHTVRVWDLTTGRLERTLEGHTGWVTAVAVTPDGARIFSGGRDRTVRVWELTSGRLERTLEGHAHDVLAVAVTPDGRRILSGGQDRTVRVWELESGRLERTLEGHTESVCAVAVTPDGRRIVSGSGDQTVRVWDLASGRLERTLEGHTYAVFAVAVTPDGARIVSGGYDHIVRMWNLASGGCEQALEGHTDQVNAVAVTPDGARIVSSGDDRTVRVWGL